MSVDSRRVHNLNNNPISAGPVVYWMSRDQRVSDNWALLHAQELAVERRVPLAVVFALAPSFLGATHRQYGFMLHGLEQVAARLNERNVPFILLQGDPPAEICRFVQRHSVGAVVTDFDPLRIKRSWRDEVAGIAGVACIEVDAHNIVPCRCFAEAGIRRLYHPAEDPSTSAGIPDRFPETRTPSLPVDRNPA